MLRFVSTAALVLALSACVSPSRIIEADKWSVTYRKEQLVLSERISHASTWDGGLRITEGALAGVYKAEREDPGGVYFIGSGKPIWFSLPGNKGVTTFVRAGGIYVPHDRGQPPHFVFVVEQDAGVAGGIDDYLTQRTVQSVALPTNSAGAGANIAGNLIGFAIAQAIASQNDGKFSRLFPITDVVARQKIVAGIQTLQ